jgi:hypothetical protein
MFAPVLRVNESDGTRICGCVSVCNSTLKQLCRHVADGCWSCMLLIVGVVLQGKYW